MPLKWLKAEAKAGRIPHLRVGHRYVFNADAVVFTFKRLLENKYKYGEFVLFKEVFPYLTKVSKAGSHEVVFELSKPFFPFPYTLSVDCASIISPAALVKKREKFRESESGVMPIES